MNTNIVCSPVVKFMENWFANSISILFFCITVVFVARRHLSQDPCYEWTLSLSFRHSSRKSTPDQTKNKTMKQQRRSRKDNDDEILADIYRELCGGKSKTWFSRGRTISVGKTQDSRNSSLANCPLGRSTTSKTTHGDVDWPDPSGICLRHREVVVVVNFHFLPRQ